jgi:membrane protein DedA with SNARE-associated domain
MPYPKFLVFNAAAGIVWGATVVLVALLVWQIRRQRTENTHGTTS